MSPIMALSPPTVMEAVVHLTNQSLLCLPQKERLMETLEEFLSELAWRSRSVWHKG